MQPFSDLNIYEMFVANGARPGFWVSRTTWGNMCARVTSVGELRGPAPYFGNPTVLADLYDLQTGVLRDSAVKLPVPGTYKTWRKIEPPGWANE